MDDNLRRQDREESGLDDPPAAADAASGGARIADRRRSLLVAIAPWLLAAAVWVTWAPFVGRVQEDAAARISGPRSPSDVVVNLLMLGPLAAVIALITQRTRHRLRRTVSAVAAIAVVLEAGQWFVMARVVTVTDPLLNTLGAAVVAYLVLRTASRGSSRIVLIGALALPVVVWGFFVLLSGGVPDALLLRDLDPGHAVTIASDFGGAWPYRGSVRAGLVCAGFGSERTCATPGSTPYVFARLAAVAEASQHIELQAQARSAPEGQLAPARIVSFSGGGYSRNATIGQELDAIWLAYRSARTGPNGWWLEFYLPKAVRGDRVTTVAASVTRGAIELHASNEIEARSARFRFGLLEAWLLGPFPGYLNRLEPGAMMSGRVVGALLLFWPVGMILGTVVRRSARAAIAGAIAAPVVLIVFERTIWWGPDSFRYLLVAGAASLGALAVGLSRTKPGEKVNVTVVAPAPGPQPAKRPG